MSSPTYVAALEFAGGAVLVFAVMTLWRRDVKANVMMLRLQGVSLAVVAGVLAAHQHDLGLGVTAVLVLSVKGFVAPELLRRVVRRDPRSRETAPLVNVPASLVTAAALIVISFVVSAKVIALAPSPATRLVPIGMATILVGYFMLVTRRRAVSQIIGLLLVDNGIALVTFLLTAGVPLIVELGASLDVLLVVVVLQVLLANMRQRLGTIDLDQLRELHD
jgi:hydrogenase-4 component E